METRKEKLERLIKIIFGEETQADKELLDARERMEDIREKLEGIKSRVSKLDNKMTKQLNDESI